MKDIIQFMKEVDGTTAVEYGLMIALISAALVAAVTLVGTNTFATFTNIAGFVAS